MASMIARSHMTKSVFVPKKANFQNEIIWHPNDGHSNRGYACRSHNNYGYENYKRNKLEVSNTAHLSNNGIQYFDGVCQKISWKCWMLHYLKILQHQH